jgi:hypothetical protein
MTNKGDTNQVSPFFGAEDLCKVRTCSGSVPGRGA